jgi:hypothetical protein
MVPLSSVIDNYQWCIIADIRGGETTGVENILQVLVSVYLLAFVRNLQLHNATHNGILCSVTCLKMQMENLLLQLFSNHQDAIF